MKDRPHTEGVTEDATEDAMEFVLDCSNCPRQQTGGCDDCVVAYLLDRPAGAVVFNAAEERAIRSLSRAGLLPEARFKRTAG